LEGTCGRARLISNEQLPVAWARYRVPPSAVGLVSTMRKAPGRSESGGGADDIETPPFTAD